jgi:endonuclease/exonuclease/phosphatase (EEP) superfamily protein YafD
MMSVVSCGFFISYISTYNQTYNNQTYTAQKETSSPSEWLSFFYANIYHKNENFSGLISTIQNHNPDIVLLVEYAKIHDEYIASILKEEYPYVSRYVGGQGYDGDVIYSRYPLQKIKHTIYPWSFSHVSIKYNSKNIDFALIHTSAPVSVHFFEMRNNQLSDLSYLLTTYYTTPQTKNIVLVWDFNITPRSNYYKRFANDIQSIWLHNISNSILNTTYNTIFPYTRCHEQAPYLCSHIDHVRSNTNISLEKISIPWSDHYGFIGKM